MNRRLIVALATGTALLAGCGGTKAGNTQVGANAQVPPATNTAAPKAEAAPAAAPGITSAYTDIDLARCQSLSSDPEHDSASWRCPGYNGIPVFISSGDLRYDIDAGVDNENFQTLPPFNENPTRIEWRLRDGNPFAIIFRLRLATNEQTEWSASALGIATVGTTGRPGCTIAWIDGNVPEANAVAQRIADQRAPNAQCAGGEPEMIHADSVPAR
jgi:hypothetical protein